MIGLEDRQTLVRHIDEAHAAGARLRPACEVAGMTLRTLQRWKDLYSRKIVGWEIHAADEAEHAVSLLKRTALAEGLHALPEKPVLHGDNGSTLKATMVLAMLH